MSQWIATTSDEHALCDDRGMLTRYRVRRDPVTGLYRAYEGDRRIAERVAIYPCKRACEELHSPPKEAANG